MKAKIGVVCLVRNTYDYTTATQMFEKTKDSLLARDDIDWKIYASPIFEDEEAERVALWFKTEAVDALVLLSGTFHLGSLALIISKHHKGVPTLLWAYPELPYDGGKIRLNSLCGLNLDASNLYKSGKRDHVTHIGEDIDDNFIGAVKIDVFFKHAKIGIVGHHAQGFYNIDVDEMSLYEHFGMLVSHHNLDELLSEDYEPDLLEHYKETIKAHYVLTAVDDYRLMKCAELCARLVTFYKKHGLDGLAIRCWPEFANRYGIAPCAAMSVLQSEGLLLSCEGDIDGLISMMAHKVLSPTPPFLADLSKLDVEKNTILLWHCGVAPYKLHDGISECTLDTYFSGGRGVTAGFVLRPGLVNLARFDSVNGNYRLFTGNGTLLETEKELCGTYADCSFAADVRDVFAVITRNGCAHHLSLSYNADLATLTLFSSLKGIEVIPLL